MDAGTVRPSLCIVAAAILGGCVAYHPESLPKKPDLKASVAGLTLPAQRLQPIPGLRPCRINPHAALSGTDVAILAVLNDPRLRASETHRGVASAAVFAAGLLPDPVLSLTGIHPTGGGGSTQSGSNVGLSEALVPLVTRSARVRAAQARLREVDLGLLWKAWQVAQRARWLAAEIIAERKLLAGEEAAWGMARDWRRRLRSIDMDGAASIVETTRLEQIVGRIASDRASTRQKLNDDQHRLHELLGLEPSARLLLRPSPPPHVGSAAVAAALENLPKRRADLLALAAGFRSKDERLRAAIAAQFPAITLSFLRESDVEGVTSLGIGLNLRLPFFNGNHGAIRKAEASREALRASYQARLDQAVSGVSRLRRNMVVLKQEAATLKSRKRLLVRSRHKLRRLAKDGSASRLESVQAAMQFYQVERRQIAAELALRKTEIALETVLGVPAERLARTAPRQGS